MCGWQGKGISSPIRRSPLKANRSVLRAALAGALLLNLAPTVDQNPNATPRSGFMTIALINVTVTQAGAICTFTMTPTSQNFPVSGGSSTFLVQTACGWQAAGNVNWIALNNANNGISGVPVTYSATANTCVADRSGSITLQQTNLTTPPTQ